jgi:hypothetical protein
MNDFSLYSGFRMISKEKTLSNYNRLGELRDSFVRIRNLIKELDQSLSWVLIIDLTETIVGVMINIYVYSISGNNEVMKKHLSYYAFKSTTSVIKLIIGCYINGLVHEESDRIYSVLDESKARNLNDFEYKEWLMFKNVSKDQNFGFTVGGFAPMRKTTLIPVKINFQKNQ